jgi:hypothetical protein
LDYCGFSLPFALADGIRITAVQKFEADNKLVSNNSIANSSHFQISDVTL